MLEDRFFWGSGIGGVPFIGKVSGADYAAIFGVVGGKCFVMTRVVGGCAPVMQLCCTCLGDWSADAKKAMLVCNRDSNLLNLSISKKIEKGYFKNRETGKEY